MFWHLANPSANNHLLYWPVMQPSRWFVLKRTDEFLHVFILRTYLCADDTFQFWFSTSKALLAWNTKVSFEWKQLFNTVETAAHYDLLLIIGSSSKMTWIFFYYPWHWFFNQSLLKSCCCSEQFLGLFSDREVLFCSHCVKTHFCSFRVCSQSWQHKCWAIASSD